METRRVIFITLLGKLSLLGLCNIPLWLSYSVQPSGGFSKLLHENEDDSLEPDVLKRHRPAQKQDSGPVRPGWNCKSSVSAPPTPTSVSGCRIPHVAPACPERALRLEPAAEARVLRPQFGCFHKSCLCSPLTETTWRMKEDRLRDKEGPSWWIDPSGLTGVVLSFISWEHSEPNTECYDWFEVWVHEQWGWLHDKCHNLRC